MSENSSEKMITIDEARAAFLEASNAFLASKKYFRTAIQFLQSLMQDLKGSSDEVAHNQLAEEIEWIGSILLKPENELNQTETLLLKNFLEKYVSDVQF